MLIAQGLHFTWHLAGLTYSDAASPPRGRCSRGAGASPGSWTQILPLTIKCKEKEKKPLCSRGQDELWLAWKCCLQQPHHHKQDRRTWRTDGPSGTRGCLV